MEEVLPVLSRGTVGGFVTSVLTSHPRDVRYRSGVAVVVVQSDLRYPVPVVVRVLRRVLWWPVDTPVVSGRGVDACGRPRPEGWRVRVPGTSSSSLCPSWSPDDSTVTVVCRRHV